MTLSSSFSIAANGLAAQSTRIKIHANNVANAATPNYVRKIPVLTENYGTSFEEVLSSFRRGVINTGISYGPTGANLSAMVADPTPGRKMYQPGHPEADKDGYVTMSNVNTMVDMADAMGASRLYEANLAVVSIVKGMANRALEIGRGQ